MGTLASLGSRARSLLAARVFGAGLPAGAWQTETARAAPDDGDGTVQQRSTGRRRAAPDETTVQQRRARARGSAAADLSLSRGERARERPMAHHPSVLALATRWVRRRRVRRSHHLCAGRVSVGVRVGRTS